MFNIRPECVSDYPAVYQINQKAFGRNAEADLVESVRSAASPIISLVAEREDGVLAGHILFTPVVIHDGDPNLGLMGLGPVAVLPKYQRKGIGALLTKAGLSECKCLGIQAVFVLGHPDYYPKFGFESASERGFHYRDPSFDPAFMVIELETGVLMDRSGHVRYLPEFEGT